MKSAPLPRDARHGFTLIEVIVALGLGLVLVFAAQSLAMYAHRAARAIETRDTARSMRELVPGLLAQDLANLTAGCGIVLAENTLALSTVHALQSPRLAARHAVAVSYVTRPRDDGRVDIVRREQERGSPAPDQPGVVLASGLQAARWAVYDGQTWQMRWPTGVPRAARAVRTTLEWSDGTRCQQVLPLTPLVWRRHNE